MIEIDKKSIKINKTMIVKKFWNPFKNNPNMTVTRENGKVIIRRVRGGYDFNRAAYLRLRAFPMWDPKTIYLIHAPWHMHCINQTSCRHET